MVDKNIDTWHSFHIATDIRGDLEIQQYEHVNTDNLDKSIRMSVGKLLQQANGTPPVPNSIYYFSFQKVT
jgi:hypothetical protein